MIIYFLLLVFFAILVEIIYFGIFRKKNNLNKLSLLINETYLSGDNKTLIKNINKEELENESLLNAAKRATNFINKTLEGIYLIIHSFILSDNPKITVVIPLFNCSKTIKRAVKSIQNQNFSNFEIILVNDLSKYNASDIIEKLKNEDKRIRLINNQKNMGALYSRCIGTLSAKEKYIFLFR